MIRRNWIRGYEETDELEKELLSFFEIPDIESPPKLSFAARKASTYDETTPAEVA